MRTLLAVLLALLGGPVFAQQTASQNFTIVVQSSTSSHLIALSWKAPADPPVPPGAYPQILPDTNGGSFSLTLVPQQGTAPFIFSAVTALPTGLTLNPTTGVISGIPAQGLWTFTVKADSATALPNDGTCDSANDNCKMAYIHDYTLPVNVTHPWNPTSYNIYKTDQQSVVNCNVAPPSTLSQCGWINIASVPAPNTTYTDTAVSPTPSTTWTSGAAIAVGQTLVTDSFGHVISGSGSQIIGTAGTAATAAGQSITVNGTFGHLYVYLITSVNANGESNANAPTFIASIP